MNTTMKLSIGYLAGVLTIAGATYFAGVHHATGMFIAGALVVLVPAFAALASVTRLRAAARFLNALADSLGAAPAAAAPKAARRVKSAPDKWEEVLRGKRDPSPRQLARAEKEAEKNIEFFSDPELFERKAS